MLATESASLDDKTKKVLASLILIAMSKNQQHVSAVAANYRKLRSTNQPSAQTSHETSTPAAAAATSRRSATDPSLPTSTSVADRNLAHRLNWVEVHLSELDSWLLQIHFFLTDIDALLHTQRWLLSLFPDPWRMEDNRQDNYRQLDHSGLSIILY